MGRTSPTESTEATTTTTAKAELQLYYSSSPSI
jgi:hypothetical protein